MPSRLTIAGLAVEALEQIRDDDFLDFDLCPPHVRISASLASRPSCAARLSVRECFKVPFLRVGNNAFVPAAALR